MSDVNRLDVSPLVRAAFAGTLEDREKYLAGYMWMAKEVVRLALESGPPANREEILAVMRTGLVEETMGLARASGLDAHQAEMLTIACTRGIDSALEEGHQDQG